MRGMGVQGMHQRRALLDDPDPRVATAVDPPLVALRQAKPTLQVQIIPDPFLLVLADEQAGKEADHHRGHVVTDRILGLLESVDPPLELLLAIRAIYGPGFEGRGHRRDDLHVSSDYLLLLLDFVQAALDASG